MFQMNMLKREVPVSLICTTFNEGKSVRAFLQSVLAGSVLPEEMVIVDGGSTDDTVEQIEAISHAHPELGIRLIKSSRRLKIAEGRNVAIAAARFDIIACIDAGCIADREWLAQLTDPFFGGRAIDVVAGWYQPSPGNRLQNALGRIVVPDVRTIRPATFLPSSRSIAFRRDCWRQVGGYPEHLRFAGEDTAFDLSLRRMGFTFEFAPRAVVFWEMRDNWAAVFRQFYRYGFGDGEAGQLGAQYIRRIAALVFPPILLLRSGRPYEFFVRYVVLAGIVAGWMVGAMQRFRRR